MASPNRLLLLLLHLSRIVRLVQLTMPSLNRRRSRQRRLRRRRRRRRRPSFLYCDDFWRFWRDNELVEGKSTKLSTV